MGSVCLWEGLRVCIPGVQSLGHAGSLVASGVDLPPGPSSDFPPLTRNLQLPGFHLRHKKQLLHSLKTSSGALGAMSLRAPMCEAIPVGRVV